MQIESVREYKYTAEIIDFNLMKPVSVKKRVNQPKSGDKDCFRTNRRYYCNKRDCSLWAKCQKLIAEWMR